MTPIGIGALLDQAFDQYRQTWQNLLKISAWLLVVVLINIIAISIYPFAIGRETQTLSTLETFGLVLFLINNFLLGYIVVRVWILNGLLITADGPSQPMSRVSRKAWNLFWPQLWPHILTIILYTTATVAPLLVIWFLSGVVSNWLPATAVFILLFFSLSLFFIPLMLLFSLLFVPMAVVYEGKRGWEAIKASAALVHGHFWAVVVRTLVPKFLYFGILFLIQWLLVILLRTAAAIALTNADMVTLARVDSIITMTSYAAVLVFIYPLILLTDIILYKSFKS